MDACEDTGFGVPRGVWGLRRASKGDTVKCGVESACDAASESVRESSAAVGEGGGVMSFLGAATKNGESHFLLIFFSCDTYVSIHPIHSNSTAMKLKLSLSFFSFRPPGKIL